MTGSRRSRPREGPRLRDWVRLRPPRSAHDLSEPRWRPEPKLPREARERRLERETGFEPATSTLARSHSTTELFPPERPKYHTARADSTRPTSRRSVGTLRRRRPARLARAADRNALRSESRSGRVRSAERAEAHLSMATLANLLSARCADAGQVMKGGRCVDSPSAPRSSRPAPPERSGERSAQVRRRRLARRGAVQDRALVRVRELAEAQSPSRIARGGRTTQARDRSQRLRRGEKDDDAQSGAASRAARIRKGRPAHMGL